MLSAILAIFRILPTGKLIGSLVALVILCGFGVFDWFVVIRPQRGKPFKDLLVEGYHISSECGSIPAHSEMPEWMRDQSKNWQTRVGELVKQKLDTEDIQLWQGAAIIGKVSDTNMNAYQCTSVAVKLGALESLIATHYDPKLQHRDYNGPVYWFKSVDGKVNISEAFKGGNTQAGVYIESGDDTKTPQKP